jgi:hypothetical protein
METFEHQDGHDIIESEKDKEGPAGSVFGSDAAEQGAGAVASSDGTTASTGVSIAGSLETFPGASSADGVTDGGDAGAAAHEPQPPHTGSGPFPDPPQP